MNTNKKEYYTKSEVKNRGWTTKMFEIFRLVPDKIKPNPHKKSTDMHLFLKSKIDNIEKSADWKFYFNKIKNSRKNKSLSMKLYSDKQKNDLCEFVSTVPINILKMSIPQLEKKTFDDVNSFNRDHSLRRGTPYRPITKKCDVLTKHRFYVNYLRHNSEYDEIVMRIKGKIGNKAAYNILKIRVLDEIKKYYKHLSDECERQKKYSGVEKKC